MILICVISSSQTLCIEGMWRLNPKVFKPELDIFSGIFLFKNNSGISFPHLSSQYIKQSKFDQHGDNYTKEC